MAIAIGDEIEIYRGDTFNVQYRFLGNLTNWTKIWFTVKDDKDDPDSAAIVQLVESNPGIATDGLLRIAGVAPTAVGNGALTVLNVASGHVNVRIEALETAKLVNNGIFYYDFQFKTATETTTLRLGRATVTGDVGRVV